MISLRVNGKPVQLPDRTPLLAYLGELGIDPRAVAVEHNGEVVERARFESVVLGEGDVVEIVRMVGGGRQAGSRLSRAP